MCSISSQSPSKNIETEDDAFNNHRFENDNENLKFVGPHNAIESSITQSGMKAKRCKKRGASIEKAQSSKRLAIERDDVIIKF